MKKKLVTKNLKLTRLQVKVLDEREAPAWAMGANITESEIDGSLSGGYGDGVITGAEIDQAIRNEWGGVDAATATTAAGDSSHSLHSQFAGGTYSGSGSYCAAGSYTGAGNYSANGQYCGSGSYCGMGHYCGNGSYCGTGDYCGGGTYCAGGNYCGGGQYCGSGTYCADGSYSGAGDYCGDGTYCGDGSYCAGGNYCGDGEYCGSGDYCGDGQYCADGSYTGAGNYCGSGQYCGNGSYCGYGHYCGDGTYCGNGWYCGAGYSDASLAPDITYEDFMDAYYGDSIFPADMTTLATNVDAFEDTFATEADYNAARAKYDALPDYVKDKFKGGGDADAGFTAWINACKEVATKVNDHEWDGGGSSGY